MIQVSEIGLVLDIVDQRNLIDTFFCYLGGKASLFVSHSVSSDYLLRIGNGIEETCNDDNVRLPDEICIPYTGEDDDVDRLIEEIFPSLETNMHNRDYITSQAILSTKNENVDKINMRFIDRFSGQEMVYHSFDVAVDDPNNNYPPEFLNSLTPSELPPHMLKLKVNCPVILLRNLDPPNDNNDGENIKASVGNVVEQSLDVAAVGSDPVHVSAKADVGEQPNVTPLSSLDVQNESTQISSDVDTLEQIEQDNLDTLIRICEHNKPKKLNVARVLPKGP
eukprot:XP_020404739.1 uncharacterized protein LOC103647822 [Zea mays]